MKRQNKCRIVDSQNTRLKKFRERTMYNAIFTCTCCQRNLFDCNVSGFDDKLITQIETKKPGLFERAIEYRIEINVNGKLSSYICHACKKHLKAGKLPPMSAKKRPQNGCPRPSSRAYRTRGQPNFKEHYLHENLPVT